QRTVAIKLLPSDLTTPSARQRFQREAQTASSLNHPHIVTVHDVGAHEDREYIVMELVDGGTLCDWLEKERPSWRQIVELLVGVGDALAKAHAAGILHRDVKPGNILVATSGYAKLSDFGLAKLMQDGSEAVTAARPARTEPTRPGIVLGTMAYMSPEQAQGRPLDARSDIFSFGVVLYEALTGRPPFSGASGLELLQNIMHAPPAPFEGDVPAALRFVIDKALEKEPADRYQSMDEVVVDLRRALRSTTRHPVTGPAPAAAAPARPRRRAWALPIVVLAAVGLGLAIERYWLDPAVPLEIRQQRLSELAAMEERPAVSPDGRMVAFVAPVNGRRQIWGRLLDQGEPFPITTRDADHDFPRWAGDNLLVYTVTSDGELWRTSVPSAPNTHVYLGPVEGGTDVNVADQTIATFRNDDTEPALILIEQLGTGDQTVIPLATGVYSSPRWSPDGNRLAFAVRLDFISAEIHVMDADDPKQTRKIPVEGRMRGLAWLPDGSGFVFASSAGSTLPYPPKFRLWSVKDDGSGLARLPVADEYASYAEPDVTVDGAVVASRIRMDSDVWRYPIAGSAEQNTRNGERITRQTGQVQVPTVSPTGDEVAYISDSGGHSNVWVAPVDGSAPPRRITDEWDPSTVVAIPRWSTTSNRIVYLKAPRTPVAFGRTEQWLVDADGRNRELLVDSAVGAIWSHDGRWLYYVHTDGLRTPSPVMWKIDVSTRQRVRVREGAIGLQVSPDGSTAYFNPSDYRFGEIWKASPVDSGEAELLWQVPLSRIPLWPHHSDLSPDGTWLATPLLDGDTANLYIISTDDGSTKQVTDFEGATLIARQVSWSPDGRYLYAALVELDADIVLFDGVLP
ncbi:MAG: protein kinase domain-containing protein, partial [Planctomycetota bacterium]